MPFRVLYQHPALFNFEYPVTGIAQLKNIAGYTLECEILVQRTNSKPLRQHDHLVIEMIGDGTAILKRRQARVGSWAQFAVNYIMIKKSCTPPPARGVSRSHHVDKLVKLFFFEIAIGPGRTYQCIQCLRFPLTGTHFCDYLLRQHIEGRYGNAHPVQFAGTNTEQQSNAFHQVIAGNGEQPAFRDFTYCVPGSPYPLDERGDAARRTYLAHQVDVADIDPELK